MIAAGALAASVLSVGVVATASVSSASASKPAIKKPPVYYLSLGDSYAIGYQPGLPGTGGSPGFTSYVARKEKMKLENFACGGATTNSLLYGFPVDGVGGTAADPTPGCGDPAATDAVPYPDTTQEAAALAFINTPANFGEVQLVTVSISGNDVTACAVAAVPLTCVEDAQAAITTNVTQVANDLQTALDANGDTTAKIVGLTYPDVLLGAAVYPTLDPTSPLPEESVIAFNSFINPALLAAYTSVPDGSFVNVTTAPYKIAGAGDNSTGPDVKLKPYGEVSPALWEICKLTYYCSEGNIHANTKGYNFIGGLIYTSIGNI
jgi:lysophospholipase L1-like esterase